MEKAEKEQHAYGYTDSVEQKHSRDVQQAENGAGKAGFILAVLAVLCFWIPVLGQMLWLLGMVFSFIGIFKSPKSFAVAGLVLSLTGLVLFIFGVAFFAFTTVFS